MGENERGAPRAVDDAGGENAKDAAMPGWVVEDKTFRGESAGGSVEGCELGIDRFDRLGFGGATLVVETVEFFCELGRAGGVFGEEEFDDVASDVHAACGVDAWREPETDFCGGGRTVDGDLRCLHEGAETRLDWVAKLAQAEGG